MFQLSSEELDERKDNEYYFKNGKPKKKYMLYIHSTTYGVSMFEQRLEKGNVSVSIRMDQTYNLQTGGIKCQEIMK